MAQHHAFKTVMTLVVQSVHHPHGGLRLPPHARSVCLQLLSWPREEVRHDLTPAPRRLAQDMDTTVTGETATLDGGRDDRLDVARDVILIRRRKQRRVQSPYCRVSHAPSYGAYRPAF